jgi:omega-hydroxy-beta-dihydromenaquinone-9 sulfotransferase
VLVSKRIGHNRRIGLLDEVFPDARFVAMTRDGRAVARSLLAVDWWPDHFVWWYGGTPRDWDRDGGAPAELAAHHWVQEVEVIEDGLAGIAPERVHRVRYEDLVAAPHDVLAGTAAFAGLSDDPTWRAELDGVRFPNRNGDPTEVDPRVDRIQADTLRALEYA